MALNATELAIAIKVLDQATAPLRGIQATAQAALGGLAQAAAAPAKTLGGLTDVLGKVGLAGLGLQAVAGGVAAIATGMVGGNAEMERYETQLATLLGGADAAKARLAELAKFGAETPFELPEVVRAEKVLLGFGLSGAKALALTQKSAGDLRALIGDIAAGTGAGFEEIALTFGKFSAGATGEAISRLQELGIVTREQLAELGIQFSKAGELVSPLPEAMAAAVKIAEGKFGGGMKTLAQTFEGQMSTLADNFNQAKNVITQPIFEVLKEGVAKANEVLGSAGFQAALQQVAALLAGGVKSGLDGLKTVLPPIIDAVTTFVGALSGTWQPAPGITQFHTIVGQIGQVIQAVRDGVLTFIGAISGAWQPAPGITDFHRLIGEIGLKVGEVARAIVGWATSQSTIDAVKGAFETVKNIVTDLGPKIGAVASKILEFATSKSTIDTIKSAFETIKGVAAELGPKIAEVAGKLVEFATSKSTIDTITTAFTTIKTAAETIGPKVADIVKKIAEFATSQSTIDAVKTAFEATKTAVEVVAPKVGEVVKAIADFATSQATLDAVKGAFEGVKGAVEGTATAAANVVSFFRENTAAMSVLVGVTTATATGYALATAAAIAHGVATTGLALATGVMTAAQWLLNAALSANPIGMVVLALAGLAAGLVYAYTNSEDFRKGVDSAWAAVQSFGSWLGSVAGTLRDTFGPAVSVVAGYVIGLATDLRDDLVGAFTVAKTIVSGLASTFDRVGAAISTVLGWIGKLTERLQGLSLPDWLTPGSPTPFELGLGGISTALADVTGQLHGMDQATRRLRLPALMVPALAPPAPTMVGAGRELSAFAMAGQAGGGVVINQTNTIDARGLAPSQLTQALGADLAELARRRVLSGAL